MRKKLGFYQWRRAAFILFVIVLMSSACSKQTPHIVIQLKQGQLENLPMGSWLAFFHFDYSEGAKDLKLQVVEQLQIYGKLVDEYVYEDEDNKVGARVWDYQGARIKAEYYRGGVWEGPKVIPAQEYYAGGPAENLWITIEFEKGIPYSTLLPNQDHMLDPVREYEHAVTVESLSGQRRRLFLFGYGPLCRRISLF